jgi:hypothetical protein
MSRVQLSSTIARSQSQISTHLNSEVIILGLASQEYYSLDGVGARIWELLEEPRTVPVLVEVLLQEYDVTRERCTADLLALVQELADAGCIEVAHDTTRL